LFQPVHRLGYACLNQTLAEHGVRSNRSIELATFMDEGLDRCGDLALQNMQDLLQILKWNVENDIYVFRMTSQLFPWGTEYDLTDLPQWRDILPVMGEVGKYVREQGIRLSFHPGPYNNLASPDAKVVSNTIRELEYHSSLLDWLEQPESHMAKINIHLGGSYGSKSTAIKRFVKNFPQLSEACRSRFTLENDDRESLYSVADLYSVYESTGIPIVFDGHHWETGAKSGTYREDCMKALSTWGDIVPTVHWSNSRRDYEDSTAKPQAHSDWYYKTMSLPNVPLDIMLESKKKELALLKLRKDM
jgi:UV DNA damage endonuclease